MGALQLVCGVFRLDFGILKKIYSDSARDTPSASCFPRACCQKATERLNLQIRVGIKRRELVRVIACQMRVIGYPVVVSIWHPLQKGVTNWHPFLYIGATNRHPFLYRVPNWDPLQNVSFACRFRPNTKVFFKTQDFGKSDIFWFIEGFTSCIPFCAWHLGLWHLLRHGVFQQLSYGGMGHSSHTNGVLICFYLFLWNKTIWWCNGGFSTTFMPHYPASLLGQKNEKAQSYTSPIRSSATEK